MTKIIGNIAYVSVQSSSMEINRLKQLGYVIVFVC